MNQDLEEKLVATLVNILGDGLNRSLNALEDAGAIDLADLRTKYSGVGSEYYDVVTEALEKTANEARTGLREIIESHSNE